MVTGIKPRTIFMMMVAMILMKENFKPRTDCLYQINWGRRLSFCARMSGIIKQLLIPCTKELIGQRYTHMGRCNLYTRPYRSTLLRL